MAEEKKNIVTKEGLIGLQNELEDLKQVRRKEVANKIKEAREQGDLSENAEYDAAKEEQREIEFRIGEIEKILKNVVVVDTLKGAAGNKGINIGWTVKIHNEEFNEDMECTIVGSTEVDILNGKISNESPIGIALMGKKKGDKIEVETANADIANYTILEAKKIKKKEDKEDK